MTSIESNLNQNASYVHLEPSRAQQNHVSVLTSDKLSTSCACAAKRLQKQHHSINAVTPILTRCASSLRMASGIEVMRKVSGTNRYIQGIFIHVRTSNSLWKARISYAIWREPTLGDANEPRRSCVFNTSEHLNAVHVQVQVGGT